MIINRLRLEKWKVFDDKEFSFEEGVNIVEGKNYSGKTSFIQGIYFALFNETLYKQLTAKELIKEGEKEASVELDFTINSQEYRIRRNISGEKIIREESYLYRLENGVQVEELESVSKKGEKLRKLEDLFKINKRYIKNVNFIQEGSIFKLLINPESKILEDIYQILQLDYFSELNDYCIQIGKELDKKIKSFETKFSEASEKFDNINLDLNNIEKEIDEKNKLQTDLKAMIDDSKKILENYSKLEQIINKKERILSKIKNEEEKQALIQKGLENLQNDLNSMKMLEKELNTLKEKSELYEKNKIQLESLNKEKKDIEHKLNRLNQSNLLLKDKKSQLFELEGKRTDLNNQLKDMDMINAKLRELETKLGNYYKYIDDYKNLETEINKETEILENFIKGTCPITNDECPVSKNFIEKYTKSLEKLKGEKEELKNLIDGIENPEADYFRKKEQKERLEQAHEQLKVIKVNIERIDNEIKEITNGEDYKIQLENSVDSLEKKIQKTSDENKNLEKIRENYLVNKEKVKEKAKINEKISDKHSQLNEIKSKIASFQEESKEKEKEIEEYKTKIKLTDLSEIEKERRRYTDGNTQLSNININIENNKFKIEQLNKRKYEIIGPYNSLEELEAIIKKIVHEKYRIKFFQEALNLTLDDLKTRKLKSIQDFCTKMWGKFRIESGMHLIDWDKNFHPVIKIGGNKRNLYQLSSSEKMFLYITIRAALLSELGPNFFFIIDNLLNPFMADNQKIILEEVKDIIDDTNIKQIIFTGFDLAPDIKCNNHIII